MYTPIESALWEPETAFNKFGTLSANPSEAVRAAADPNQGNQVPNFTGLLGMTNILTYEVQLKAYDSFNADIASYVEKINVEENAGLQLNTENLNNNQKYVQFTIWRDTDKNHPKIVMYEARIFTYHTGETPSAKCVWFSPDLTVDIVRRKNIKKDTNGTFTAYKYPFATYKDSLAEKDYNIVEDYYFTDTINKKMETFGTIAAATSCRQKMWPRVSKNDESSFIVSKYYQYEGDLTNLPSSSDTTLISDTKNIWAGNYTGISVDKSPNFIELLIKINRQTNKIETYQINYHTKGSKVQNPTQNNGGSQQQPSGPINPFDEERIPTIPVESIALAPEAFNNLK